MRDWQCGDAISSNAVDVVHGDAGDGDDHSKNTDGHKGEEDNTEHGECGTCGEDHTGDGHGDTGGKEDHTEHGQGGGGTWVGGGWSQAADDGDGWSQAAGDSDDRWHEATYKGDTEQQDHVSHSWYDVHNSCKEEKEHGGEGCTGGTGWDTDDWGPQWPHSGDDTWMGDQYDEGCWCMQRGSYIGR